MAEVSQRFGYGVCRVWKLACTQSVQKNKDECAKGEVLFASLPAKHRDLCVFQVGPAQKCSVKADLRENGNVNSTGLAEHDTSLCCWSQTGACLLGGRFPTACCGKRDKAWHVISAGCTAVIQSQQSAKSNCAAPVCVNRLSVKANIFWIDFNSTSSVWKIRESQVESRRFRSSSPHIWCSCILSQRAYSKNNGSGAPPHRTKTAYYDILQVSANATQTQVKTAYYKQSFVYHPDRNAGSQEATKRFSEISEAYLVLGNRYLRKKYDQGLLSQADLQGAGRPSAKEAPGPASKPQKEAPSYSPTEGRGAKPTFDFDHFYQAHYGEQLQREKEQRGRREAMVKKQQEGYMRWKLGKLMELSVGLMFATGLAIMFSIHSTK